MAIKFTPKEPVPPKAEPAAKPKPDFELESSEDGKAKKAARKKTSKSTKEAT